MVIGQKFRHPRIAAQAQLVLALIVCVAAVALAENAVAFEGRIEIVITQGSETTPLLYTVGPNFLRIEVTGSARPNPIDLVDLKSGAITILFPHNRSFVRLKSGSAGASPDATAASPSPQSPPSPFGGSPNGAGESPALPIPQMPAMPPGVPSAPPGRDPAGKMPAVPMPQMPAMPPGIGPQSGPGAGMPQMPAMPQMPMMPPMGQKIELKATGKKEKLLGFNCEQYEIKQRGETLEIWATDQLFPYQAYMRNQTPRFGPRMIEEQWPELLSEKKLFPLRAILRFDAGPGSPGGAERFRFEVKSVKPEKIHDKDGTLFQPPPNYMETRPLPF